MGEVFIQFSEFLLLLLFPGQRETKSIEHVTVRSDVVQ